TMRRGKWRRAPKLSTIPSLNPETIREGEMEKERGAAKPSAYYTRDKPSGRMRWLRVEVHGQVINVLQQEWIVEWCPTDRDAWQVDKREWRNVPFESPSPED